MNEMIDFMAQTQRRAAQALPATSFLPSTRQWAAGGIRMIDMHHAMAMALVTNFFKHAEFHARQRPWRQWAEKIAQVKNHNSESRAVGKERLPHTPSSSMLARQDGCLHQYPKPLALFFPDPRGVPWKHFG